MLHEPHGSYSDRSVTWLKRALDSIAKRLSHCPEKAFLPHQFPMAGPCPQEQYPVFLTGVMGEICERRQKLIVRPKRIEDRHNLVIRDEEKTGR